MRPRIRTIKPEIFEDEAVGRLGAWERLLFIGLITMADDEGRLRALPAPIAGHIFPYDEVPVAKLKRWLSAVAETGLAQLYESEGTPYLQIKGWSAHQKINRMTPSEIPPPPDSMPEPYKKRAIPEKTRREVALRAGAVPGETTAAACHYCNAPGKIVWKRLSSGRPGSWVQFGRLELDHVVAEVLGGSNEPDNIVLACQTCNRSKGGRSGDEFQAGYTLRVAGAG